MYQIHDTLHDLRVGPVMLAATAQKECQASNGLLQAHSLVEPNLPPCDIPYEKWVPEYRYKIHAAVIENMRKTAMQWPKPVMSLDEIDAYLTANSQLIDPANVPTIMLELCRLITPRYPDNAWLAEYRQELRRRLRIHDQ